MCSHFTDRFRSFTLPAIIAAIALALGIANTAAHAQLNPNAEIVYVNIANDIPFNQQDGDSWETAYRFLQDGLNKADFLIDEELADAVEIWVAAAFDVNGDPIPYRPDQRGVLDGCTPGPSCCPPAGDCNRTHSFQLRNNVAIYGGFAGDEEPEEFHLRNWKVNQTVLSGDLQQNSTFIVDCGDGTFCEHGIRVDDEGEPVQDADCDTCRPVGFTYTNYETNSLRIVVAANVNATAVLDGFHIRHGYAGLAGTGRAISVTSGNPTIERCVAEYHVYEPFGFPPNGMRGDVIRITASTPEIVLRHINVRHNLARIAVGFSHTLGADGAALLFSRVSNNLLGQSGIHIETKATILNCEVTGNDLTAVFVASGGAAISAFASNVHARIWNSLIADNISDNHGGGFRIGGLSSPRGLRRDCQLHHRAQ
jgi:hypothetical protein